MATGSSPWNRSRPVGRALNRQPFWSTGWPGARRLRTWSVWLCGFITLGIRVVRINLRGAGSGFGLARGIYHAGRSDDLRAVVTWLERRVNGSPIALVGFSLGGNLVLKLAAEAAETAVPGSRLRSGGQPSHRPGRFCPPDAAPG